MGGGGGVYLSAPMTDAVYPDALSRRAGRARAGRGRCRMLEKNAAFKQGQRVRHTDPGGPGPGPGKISSYFPDKECQRCEDVAQTFRETFPCVGHTEPDWTPGVSNDLPACMFVAACGAFTGANYEATRSIQEACADMKKDMYEGSKKEATWTALAALSNSQLQRNRDFHDPNKLPSFPDALRVCQGQVGGLGFCNDATCDAHLATDECRDNPGCEGVMEACDRQCYLCYWLVRSFPVFMESCAPSAEGSWRKASLSTTSTWKRDLAVETAGFGSPPLEKTGSV